MCTWKETIDEQADALVKIISPFHSLEQKTNKSLQVMFVVRGCTL